MLANTKATGAPRLFISLTVVTVALSAHCGQSVRGIDPDPTVRDPFPTADSAVIVIPGDGGPSTDAGVTDANPFVGLDGRVRSGDTRTGIVTVSSTLFSGNLTNVASATFFRRERERVCPTLSDGEFFFADCPDTEEPDGETIPRAHAGRIEVRNQRGTIARLSPEADGSYTPFNTLDSSVSPGTEITFSAMGAEVPAFVGRVSSPAAVAFRVDPLPANTLRVTQPVTVRWNPMSGERITIVVNRQYTSPAGADRTVYVGATYVSSVGSATIPPRVLRRLAVAGTTTQFFVYGSAENRTDLQAGEWPIIARAVRTEVDETVQFER
ncbi:MAG: hypothetical protein JNK05_07540 [Myxococcales bacterium]|nr:hypothetical protein [Myxococcales bacterium]